MTDIPPHVKHALTLHAHATNARRLYEIARDAADDAHENAARADAVTGTAEDVLTVEEYRLYERLAHDADVADEATITRAVNAYQAAASMPGATQERGEAVDALVDALRCLSAEQYVEYKARLRRLSITT